VSQTLGNPKEQLVVVGSWPGLTQKLRPGNSQWLACEYAGCICVTIVVPMVAAVADSNNTKKTMIFFIFPKYMDMKYLSSTFYRLFTLLLYVIRDKISKIP
jgi:succinate dehydrogenase hydrophobic anchor subunit